MIYYRSWPDASPAGTLWRVISDEPQHRILPDGVMDLVCSDGKFMFAGPDTKAVSVKVPSGSATWGLHLAPGVAHALIGIPANDVRGERVALDDLVSLPASLVDAAYQDPETALTALVHTLWIRAAVNVNELRLAASLDRAARNGLSVTAIAEEHYLSERSLRRLSDHLFGYGPKTLTSIHRFRRALRLLRGGTSFGETAAKAGYADQAHLSREVKRLTGTTLTALLN
ncbi:helix-turn-helix domain-containing protein [Rhodococcus sp. ABRD24]|uniref:helix-turn-helix domain-containing protein n=1 Tax=Rhodococcus sp. ABRD24 TaxID=2507582 RepID=UPI00103B729E|nr:helix-turn-helix domain-containing protein [Rhodococcus sp. ABRD24]QBJ97010.1 helix-turn-helix domain-containing protein [Rhodococcus sp. ABRD24]